MINGGPEGLLRVVVVDKRFLQEQLIHNTFSLQVSCAAQSEDRDRTWLLRFLMHVMSKRSVMEMGR